MPKKKTNVNVDNQIAYDTELTYGEPGTKSLKVRTLVPYKDFCQAAYGVIETLFANGYSPAEYSYIFNATLIKLYTDYGSSDPDDILREVYINHIDEAIYAKSIQALAFRNAVNEAINCRNNRSSFDVFFDNLNSIDVGKLNALIEKLSAMQFTKDEITNIVMDVIKTART